MATPHPSRSRLLASCALALLLVTGSVGDVPARPSVPPGAANSVVIRPVDGSPDYFSRFTSSMPASPAFFPVGVWSESLVDAKGIEVDRAAGLNTYVEMTGDSDPAAAKQAGSYAVSSGASGSSAGFFLGDEVDMWAGPGSDKWTGAYPGRGEICEPSGSKCGYSVLHVRKAQVPPGMASFANFGKGVLFWETDRQAQVFVNSPDVVSADAYWFTDPDICAINQGGSIVGNTRALTAPECRRAANYGWTVDRVRSLVNPTGSKPVWAFIEVGHPFPNGTTIDSAEIRAAVWSSIIHGARGIVYFNHNIGGPCPSQHVLRDACGSAVRAEVTAIDQQLAELAPVLNAPFVDHAVSVRGAADVAVKVLDRNLYVFVASSSSAPQTVAVDVPCWVGSSATVLGEARSVTADGHVLRDSFADGNSVHIYRLEGGNGCGL